MAERGLNPFVKAFRNFIRSLRPSYMFAPKGRMVGSDHLGNRYFQYEKENSKQVRFYKPKDVDQWDEPLPPEWNAWLRFLRKDPPTPEESMKNLQRIEILKQKLAKDKEESDKTQQQQEKPTKQTDGKYPKYAEYEQYQK